MIFYRTFVFEILSDTQVWSSWLVNDMITSTIGVRLKSVCKDATLDLEQKVTISARYIYLF